MKKLMTAARLRDAYGALEPRGGAPIGAAASGFRPAFLDFATCTIHLARFADGRLAPLHLLEGLPAAVVAKGTLISGFERGGYFYTRRAVAKACEEWRF